MNKNKIKEMKIEKTVESSSVDLHRKKPKAKGGIISKENCEIKEPVEHMKLHNNHRDRKEWRDRRNSLKKSWVGSTVRLPRRSRIMQMARTTNAHLGILANIKDHLRDDRSDK